MKLRTLNLKTVGLILAASLALPALHAQDSPVTPVDCATIGQDLKAALEKEPELVLVFIEDTIIANEECACEVVKAAIEGTEADKELVRQIVYTAVSVAPGKAATIAECAIASSPGSAEEIKSALEAAPDAMIREVEAVKEVKIESPAVNASELDQIIKRLPEIRRTAHQDVAQLREGNITEVMEAGVIMQNRFLPHVVRLEATLNGKTEKETLAVINRDLKAIEHDARIRAYSEEYDETIAKAKAAWAVVGHLKARVSWCVRKLNEGSPTFDFQAWSAQWKGNS